MDAPIKGLGVPEFSAVIRNHVLTSYRRTEDGSFVCVKCGAKVLQTTGYASIHGQEFGDLCAGFGDVKRFPLPYCPNCEGKPQRTDTCVHIPVNVGDLVLVEADPLPVLQ